MTSERDLMREEFEAWASSQNWIIDRDSFGDYRHSTARDGWEAWQAARRAQHSTAEPVAWIVYIPSEANQRIYDSQDDAGYIDDLTNHEDAEVTPLFAAPQQAPLTAEQVRAVVKEAGFDCPNATYAEQAAFINGLRHAEAAHGISAAKETSNG